MRLFVALVVSVLALAACNDDSDVGISATTTTVGTTTTDTGSGDGPTTSSSTTPSTTAPPDEGLDPIDDTTVDDVVSPDFPTGGGPVAYLAEVRQAAHDGFHRIVLEFEGTDVAPSYRVSYIDAPVRRDGSGEVISVEGESWLEVRTTPATHVDLRGPEPELTYTGPERIPIDRGIVNELVLTGDFEANMAWVVGVDSPEPFAVGVLDDPLRLVVDIVPG